ncbi:MAG: AAA family ATPase [Planctomycetes bacterium]|nr:AAA family ATPase [Planctomycetota bacterium]
MFDRVRVAGYRSLREVDLPLGPLTVLIGPNGSGKSNLLDIFALLSEIAGGRLAQGLARRGGIRENLWAGRTERLEIRVRFALGTAQGSRADRLDYELVVDAVGVGHAIARETLSSAASAKKNRGPSTPFASFQRGVGAFADPGGNPPAGRDRDAPGAARKWQLDAGESALSIVRDPLSFPTSERVRSAFESISVHFPLRVDVGSEVRRAQFVRAETKVAPGGENLVSVLSHLHSRRDFRKAHDEIRDALAHAFPEFEDFSCPPEGGDGKVVLRWKERDIDRDLSALQVADGMLRFLLLATILCDPKPPLLICVDEPEVGLHPSLLLQVAELLRRASSRTQVLAATHAPALVDALHPEEVVVVEKEGGGTGCRRLDSAKLKNWLREFSLGSLWQSGEIGGRS